MKRVSFAVRTKRLEIPLNVEVPFNQPRLCISSNRASYTMRLISIDEQERGMSVLQFRRCMRAIWNVSQPTQMLTGIRPGRTQSMTIARGSSSTKSWNVELCKPLDL